MSYPPPSHQKKAGVASSSSSSTSSSTSSSSSTLSNFTLANMMGPCVNARQCLNLPGSFSCVCLEGWGGPTCATDFDDCVGQCKNGATCQDLVNDYRCLCATGFTGMYRCNTKKQMQQLICTNRWPTSQPAIRLATKEA